MRINRRESIAEFNTRKIEQFKSLSLEERRTYLLKYWKIEDTIKEDGTFMLVGSYEQSSKLDKNGNAYGYFVNIRNLRGDILYYPFSLGPVKVWTGHKPALQTKEFWLIHLTMDNGKMSEKNPFSIRLADTIFGQPKDTFKEKVEKERFIKEIFETTGHTKRDAENEANALDRLMGDLYTETERFVFELLQNADDQPRSSKEVSVHLRIANDQLMFMHNGKPFDSSDVESISSIGISTKVKDAEKIGYKGIGFKSVFSDSDTVYINSGDFSFSFDKYSYLYRNEEDMNKVPWQIKPIWAERYRYPKEVQEDDLFFKSPVGIALTIPTEKIEEYSRLIPDLLNEPRFVLFLRNITSLAFSDNGGNNIIITKKIANGVCDIYINGTLANSWVVQDYVVDVDEDTVEAIQYDKLVPQKMREVSKVKITFAARVENGTLSPLSKDQSILFTYLPTKVDSFAFPFLINADFLTTASREDIHYKSPWNLFIFRRIGEKIVDWVVNLAEKGDGYLNLLPTSKPNAEEKESKNILINSFYSAYVKALESESFIKDADGLMRKQEEIILDNSGLSNIIGQTLFCSLIDTKKHLPHSSIVAKFLKNTIFSQVEEIDTVSVVENMTSKFEVISNWVQSANDTERELFFKWLLSHKEDCKSILSTIPLILFNDKLLSLTEASADNCIITSTKLLPVKNSLEKLGLSCSTHVIDSHILYSVLELPTEKSIFNKIQSNDFSALSFAERKSLFIKLGELEGVGSESLKSLLIFNNCNGVLSPLSNMTKYNADLPKWLNAYMLSEVEYDERISIHLISSDNIYQDLVKKNITSLLQSVKVQTIYDAYSFKWDLTSDLIGKVPSDELLGIVNLTGGTNLKKAFIESISTINLLSTKVYTTDEFEYRLLSMALTEDVLIPTLRTKLTIDTKPLSEYTIKDTITVKIGDKVTTFSLSKLLPTFVKSGITELILKSFEAIPNVSKLFELAEMPLSTVNSKLHDYRRKVKGLMTAEQFCYMMCYEKSFGRNYFNSYVRELISINSIPVFTEILERSYELDIPEILNTFIGLSGVEYPFTKFKDTFFGADEYALTEEIAPAWVTQWADTDNKKKFLKALGLKDVNSEDILRRKAYLNEKVTANWDITSTYTICRFLDWVNKTQTIPVIGKREIEILRPLVRVVKRSYAFDVYANNLTSAIEWDDEKYLTWKTSKKLKIYLFDGCIPYVARYPEKDSVFFVFNDGDYYYDPLSEILYLNKQQDIEVVLANVYSSRVAGFTKDDWTELFRVKRSDFERIEEENIALKKLNEELQNQLHQLSDPSDAEKYIDVIERGTQDKETQKIINLDSRIRVKIHLAKHGYDVSSWNPEVETPDIVGLIKTPEGTSINVVVRSSKQGKIHLSASSFETLMSHPDNLLIVENHEGINSITFTELFGNNSNVNLIFDARHTPIEYFKALGMIFKYVKNTQFVVYDPCYSTYDEIQGFGLDIRNDGVVIIGSEINI